jgi:hypothetical protein
MYGYNMNNTGENTFIEEFDGICSFSNSETHFPEVYRVRDIESFSELQFLKKRTY